MLHPWRILTSTGVRMALIAMSAPLVLAMTIAILGWPGLSNAAAPVLSAPKSGLGGKAAGTPPAGLPEPSIPATGAKPADPAPKKPGGASSDGHDHSHSGKDGKDAVIETVDLPVLPVLARSARSDWANGYKTIRATIAALRAEAARAKLEPKGRPLIVYLESTDKDFRVDILLPLASEPGKDVQVADGFRTGHNPGGKAMKFEHRGAYSQIEQTYEAITAYLDEKGLSAREFFIEEFVNEIADPNDIKMAVNIYVFLK